MGFVFKFCSKCGKRFINPSDNDFNECCPICSDNDQSVGKEINDTFSQEEVRKIMMGPNSSSNCDSVDIDELFDDSEDDTDNDLDYQDFDEQFDFDEDEEY